MNKPLKTTLPRVNSHELSRYLCLGRSGGLLDFIDFFAVLCWAGLGGRGNWGDGMNGKEQREERKGW